MIIARTDALNNAKALLRKYVPRGRSLVKDLLEHRGREAASEGRRAGRFGRSRTSKRRTPGQIRVEEMIEDSIISVVNQAEIHSAHRSRHSSQGHVRAYWDHPDVIDGPVGSARPSSDKDTVEPLETEIKKR